MKRGWHWLKVLTPAAICLAAGVIAFKFMPLAVWTQMASGLFVVLSVCAAAVFVRLARPSPFSNPDVFSAHNIEGYFDTLAELAKRLVVVLIAIGSALLALIVAVALPQDVGPSALSIHPILRLVEPSLSALLACLWSYIVIRFSLIVHGDLGFIELQRRIVSDAHTRKAVETSQATVEAETEWRSAGEYGRSLEH